MGKTLLMIVTILMLFSVSDKRPVKSSVVEISQEVVPENQTQTTISPDGKYRAEAYGTITSITAGGGFPYEGIRVVNADDGEVIWKMEPGYYAVNFLWSTDSSYIGIYYEARIWGESIVLDVKNNKSILLPKLEDIAPHYGIDVKPQENRPDPYFKISGWGSPETVVVDFLWNKEDGEVFKGQYTFNVKTNNIMVPVQ